MAEELKRLNMRCSKVDIRKILRGSTETETDKFSINTTPSSIEPLSSPEQISRRRKRWAEKAEVRRAGGDAGRDRREHSVEWHDHENENGTDSKV